MQTRYGEVETAHREENNRGRVLLVDDEANILKVLSAILRKSGYEVHTAKTAEEALDRTVRMKFDTVITDYKLPGMNGSELLDALKTRAVDAPVIMLTAYGTIEKAVDAMRKGAYYYLAKPVNPDELLTVTREAVEKHRLLLENISLKTRLKERHSFKNIIGKSHVMQDLFSLIETVSRSNSNVLVTGESGTGKELVAKAIHYESPRAGGPFIPIDCAALPEELLESELFGHEKGSFTSAYDQKTGQIELANGGTVFLDEIGELSPGIQKKFLRFLQEREILRVGGKNRIKVDVRIIAATNRNLEEEVRRGAFREDLFYRLNVVTLQVPPLREKKEDIPLLAHFFLQKFNEVNKKTLTSIDSEAMRALMDYDWPGNVRELENAVERAVVLCPTDTVTLHYLPRTLRGEIRTTEKRTGEEFNLLDTEKKLILRALEKTSWNQTKASEVLGITRKQLRTKMKHHGLLAGEEKP
ncbi:MAG: sigma-54 dependent transcriptional regulator [Alphaproteobacteria bacterium]|uniref:Sigma-54 dependent transcriptional regulator n=1 Tax=Candidatus Nitrobium versatile TaxID=2884831 RepID=A0A953JCY7_9BACT|nr:sigma-54 dependent transcriptional regulator [Candidatus Nitrobium versatile]